MPPAPLRARSARRGTRLALVLFTSVLGACAGRPPPPVAPAHTAAADRYVDGRSGATLTEADAVARLLEAPLVYVGERHDRAEDHAVQARLATHAASSGGAVALGFEMFAQPYQPALDAYCAGGPEDALLDDSEWDTRWGFDFDMYRPLVALGQQEHVQLLALNAPRELTRRIARQGLDELDEEARAALAELNLEDAEHRAMIEAAFEGHPQMDAARLERFYTAQVVWDETMAERIATAMASTGPARMLVFAGVMHVQPSAIPRRAARRGALEHRVLMPLSEAELAEALEARSADVFYVTPE